MGDNLTVVALSLLKNMNMLRILIFLFLSLQPLLLHAADELIFSRIEHSVRSERDISLTTLGAFGIENGLTGHVDLGFMSTKAGSDALTLDLGAGISFPQKAKNFAIFLGIGGLAGYHFDDDYDSTILSLYPEVGMMLKISDKWGLLLTGKRYYDLYDETENMVMLGLMFRK